MERIDIDLQIARVVLRQDEIPFEMVFSVRDHLADDLNELITAHDEHAHADQIVLRRTIVNSQIDNLTVVSKLNSQRLTCLAVGAACFGDDCDITAGSNMLFEDRCKIDCAEDSCIGQHDILSVAAAENRHGGLKRLKLTAVCPGMTGGIRGQKPDALAQFEIPLLAVAEMIHQRLIIIFCDNADVADLGVCHIGQGKVNLTIAAAERDRGRSPLTG